MKQKLFLLFALGVLITAPALAAGPVHFVDSNGDGVPDTSFGALIRDGASTSTGGDFTLSITTQVYTSGGLDPIYTWVFGITHNAVDSVTGLPEPIDLFLAHSLLFDPVNLQYGWLAPDASSSPYQEVSPGVTVDPAAFNVNVGGFFVGLEFLISIDANSAPVYLLGQSYSPPSVNTNEFGASAVDGVWSGFAETWLPDENGFGSSIYVPEPSSLILLVFGLLGGSCALRGRLKLK